MRQNNTFLFDRGGEGSPAPAPVERPMRPPTAEVPPASADSARAAGVIRRALGTPGADLGQVIRDLSKRTGELGADTSSDKGHVAEAKPAPMGELPAGPKPMGELSPAHTPATAAETATHPEAHVAPRSLPDILAKPDMAGMQSLEGRIINTPIGPMVIGKPSINIGSGEVGVLAHPFGVEAGEVDTTRLSLADLRNSEVSEMSDADYLAQSIEDADMQTAVIAAQQASEMVVGASKQDMVGLLGILSEKKGRRLDEVVARAKEHQAAEDPSLRAYGMDMEVATLQLKQEQLQKRLQKYPGEKPTIEAKWNELRDQITVLKNAREELSAEQNQLTEFTRQLGVADELAAEAPLVGLQRLLATQTGRKTVLSQIRAIQEQQGDAGLGALEQTVSGIINHTEHVDLAKKTGISIAILMALTSFIIMSMSKRSG